MAKILVCYYSKGGNTKAMAEIVAKAAQDAGGEVTVKRAQDTTKEDLLAADAAAFGSPDYFSYVAGQIKVVFDEAFTVKDRLSGKAAICFLSHGGGKGAAPFTNLVSAVGFSLISPCLTCEGAPAGAVVEQLRALGRALVSAVGTARV